MTIGKKIAEITPAQWLIACAFWAIVLAAFWGGYQTGKVFAEARHAQAPAT